MLKCTVATTWGSICARLQGCYPEGGTADSMRGRPWPHPERGGGST
jgi:hypothetical protein